MSRCAAECTHGVAYQENPHMAKTTLGKSAGHGAFRDQETELNRASESLDGETALESNGYARTVVRDCCGGCAGVLGCAFSAAYFLSVASGNRKADQGAVGRW